MNELQCLTSNDVCGLLKISTKTLYRCLQDPNHPLKKAVIPNIKPFRFKQAAVMEYIGAWNKSTTNPVE
jgi:hypothetical protein